MYEWKIIINIFWLKIFYGKFECKLNLQNSTHKITPNYQNKYEIKNDLI